LTLLLGPNIDFLLNRHNHITFNRYGETVFRLHRDVLQWSRSVVTALVYLEDSNLSNGCTHIVPTSQYLPFVGTPNNGGTWMDEHSVYKDLISQNIPVIAEKGDVLFMDSLMFHSVGMNNSNQTRISLNLAYTSVDELLPLDYSKYRVLVKGERLYRGNIF